MQLLISVPYTCRLTGTRVVPSYLKVFLPVVGIAVAGWSFMVLTRSWMLSRIASVVIDSLFVLAITGIVFVKNVRDAARAGRRHRSVD